MRNIFTNEEEIINKFKQIILNKYDENDLNEIIMLDTNLFRFIQAKDFNLNEAFSMFEKVNTWRNNFLINQIKPFELELVKNIKTLFPTYWLNTDKLGHPIYVECPGIINITELLEITTIDELVTLYIKNSEFMFTYLYDFISEKTGKKIKETFTIIDLKGCSFGNINSKVYTYIKTIIKLGSMYYPETVYKMFIINTPFIFKSIWYIIKPFLPRKTRNKITILRAGQEHILFDYIDKDKLPENLDFTNNQNQNNPLEKEYLNWLKF